MAGAPAGTSSRAADDICTRIPPLPCSVSALKRDFDWFVSVGNFQGSGFFSLI